VLIRNATEAEIRQALATANKAFDNNLMFNRLDYAGRTRQGRPKFNVTLRVKNSHNKGARLGFPSYETGRQRHLIGACWHAHGTFIDALPQDTEIIATGVNHPIRPNDAWNDRNIGSVMMPMYLSEACEC